MRPLIDIFSRSCRNVAWPRSFVRSFVLSFVRPFVRLLFHPLSSSFSPISHSLPLSPSFTLPVFVRSSRFAFFSCSPVLFFSLSLFSLFSFFLLGPALAVQRPRTKRAPNICADPRNLTTSIRSKLLPSSFQRRDPTRETCRLRFISIVIALLLLFRSSSDEDDVVEIVWCMFREFRVLRTLSNYCIV